ncbi:MAG: hypothetical protein WCF48_04790 [Terriglobales bacterium]
MNTKDTIISEVKETWSGIDRDGKASALYQVIDQDGDRYSTKNGALYSARIGQPVTLTWTESESKKVSPKTNKPYINRNLVEGRAGATAPTITLQDLDKRLKRVEAFMKENGFV